MDLGMEVMTLGVILGSQVEASIEARPNISVPIGMHAEASIDAGSNFGSLFIPLKLAGRVRGLDLGSVTIEAGMGS